MLKVGLTGGLASGKSFVGREFERLGTHVIQADSLGHLTLLPDGEAYADVIREFGQGIAGPDGLIDRKALGAIVFPDEAKLEKLNSFIHPHVYQRQLDFFERVEAEDPKGVAVAEAAIMIETGGYKRYDRIVVAYCPENLQIERFIERENSTREEARSRLSRQMPIDEKRTYADHIIDTSGTKEQTLRQTRDIYLKLKAEAER